MALKSIWSELPYFSHILAQYNFLVYISMHLFPSDIERFNFLSKATSLAENADFIPFSLLNNLCCYHFFLFH